MLRFEKLDTYADIHVNGRLIGKCEDEHISHEFDVTDVLFSGENAVVIHFDSPITRTDGLPQRSGEFTAERLYTRRTQCTYGWDWVARLISCGISGNACVTEIEKDEVLVKSAYIYTKNIDEESAQVSADIEFTGNIPDRILTFTILSPEGKIVRSVQKYLGESFVHINLDVVSPKLWYPLGYGEQPIYAFEIRDGGNRVYSDTFGIRNVKIMQLPDEKGSLEEAKCREIKNTHYDFNAESSGFILKVNGKKILCQGANWVPCEPFYNGKTDSKITQALTLAAQAGLNMLRIWGGGTFETKHFYSECSRLGIMVTQDFLMACGHYPEDEDWFIDSLQREAEYAALHIRNQPCLMWWSGDNENAINGSDIQADYTGRRSAYRGIAPVLQKLDPMREFLPSSPYGGDRYASNTVGTTHNTQFLGNDIFPYILSGDVGSYREAWKKFRARFIAEEPQLGAVSVGSMRKFLCGDDIFADDDTMLRYHTKSNPRLSTHLFDISLTFAQRMLGEFISPADRNFKLRYLQYEWVRFTMEQLRREMWFCSGLIYWMYNDCWPAASGWALVDYYNKPKDAWYAFKRCAKNAVLSFDKAGGKIGLFVSNTGCGIKGADIRIAKVKGGSIREIDSFTVDVPAGQATEIYACADSLDNGEVLIAEMNADDLWDRTFFIDGALYIEKKEVHTEVLADECAVIVHADTYVHAVELEGETVFEDNCFSLLPGETRKIRYSANAPLEITAEAYTIKNSL
ncbi:MAG: hypothetical protein IJC48_07350 [Clostridia bacterium]|nr:hypothetical protein [Clostridia bacterium]